MSAREAILDAAASIMREQGIARATTKEIARRAGYSEAALYKHFADKQELFLAVLGERAPRVATARSPGDGDVRENLATLVAALMGFYEHSFPMAASIFSERELLAAWRAELAQRGAGPHLPRTALTGYLDAERLLGRVPASMDIEAAATLLCGAALYEAFLASFSDRPIDDAMAIATTWVAALRLS
jgi:AcrR family transcriptional regulator